jgi:hypothetical protein
MGGIGTEFDQCLSAHVNYLAWVTGAKAAQLQVPITCAGGKRESSMSAQYCDPGAAIISCDKVLVVCAVNPFLCSDVQSTLLGTAAFSTVDTFDASYEATLSGGTGTPTASELAAYHAVLVFSFWGFANSELIGDRLAAYHDQGGGVIVAYAANFYGHIGPTMLRGAYAEPDNGYALLNYAQGSGYNGPTDSLGDVLEPLSPLMAGVSSLAAAEAGRSTAPPIAGRAVVVAQWGGGSGGNEPLVLRGMRGNRTLVELNFWPVSSRAESPFWTGDGAALLRNALKYSRCMPCGNACQGSAGVHALPLTLSHPLSPSALNDETWTYSFT